MSKAKALLSFLLSKENPIKTYIDSVVNIEQYVHQPNHCKKSVLLLQKQTINKNWPRI